MLQQNSHYPIYLVTKLVQIENSNNWIKFLSMKKHYYNSVTMMRAIHF
jgi:hypothetical protein